MQKYAFMIKYVKICALFMHSGYRFRKTEIIDFEYVTGNYTVRFSFSPLIRKFFPQNFAQLLTRATDSSYETIAKNNCFIGANVI